MTEPGSPVRERQRTSFGDAAAVYERARPGYPPLAVDWLLPPAARAGARPRRRHRQAHPAAPRARAGRRRRRTVGRDARRVRPRAARRPRARRRGRGAASGGRQRRRGARRPGLALGRSGTGVPRGRPRARPGRAAGADLERARPGPAWVSELERIVAEPGVGHGCENKPAPVVGPRSGPWRPRRSLVGPMPPEAVVDLVASRSWAITTAPARRERLLADIGRLLATHPDTAGRSVVDLPYVTRCYRASRPA